LEQDNQIMLAVKAGQIEKLGTLFERYKLILFGYFYKTTRNKSLSEDLVQNVFLRILKYRTKFSGYGKFVAWMFKIAHNVYVDHYRKERFHQAIDDTDEKDLKELSFIEENTVKNEELNHLKKAIFLLDHDQREILILSKFNGLKYKDIGKILGCSESAVKVRIFRAVSKLKQIYNQLEV
jgi:RNA polymerase sigma factor (sigma-70 family)